MSQQIINLGNGPDSQTGDNLYTAFTKVNDNFTELYSVFDGNGITTINANVIYSNNIVTSSNVRAGNLFAYGNLETIGYIVTAGAFYPNGEPIGTLVAVETNILPITSNVFTIGNVTNQFSSGYFGTNLSLAGANVTVVNGELLVNGGYPVSNYGNANVAQYLPVYGGNISATVTTASQPYITSVGTLNGLTVSGNLNINGNLDVQGNVSYFNIRDFSVQDPIITLNTGPNGAPLISNNGFDSGVRTYYYDGESRAAFFGRANDSGDFEYYSNVISEVGNIVTGTYGTIKTGNLTLIGNASIAGNVVSGHYFLGNGRYLSGIDATLISNGTSNVKVFANANIEITSNGNQHWAFDPSGTLTFPGGSKLVPSAGNMDLIAGQAGWAELQSFDANNYIWVDDNGAYVGTNWLSGAKQWAFELGGNLRLPGSILPYDDGVYSLGSSSLRFKDLYVTGNTIDMDGSTIRSNASAVTITNSLGGQLIVDGTGVGTPNKISNGSSSVIVNANSNVSISAAGTTNVAQFTAIGGNLTGDFFITGTISALNYIGNVQGNLSAPGLNTQVLFNDNSTAGATAGFTFNKTSNAITVSGNISSLGNINVAGYNVIDSNGNVVTSRLQNSGVTADTYGNASAVPVITVDSKGRVTSATTTAVAGVSGLDYNQTTSNLSISTSAGTVYYVDLNVGTEDTPTFANVIVNTNLTAYNTATVGQLKVGSATVIDTSGEIVTSQLKNSGVTVAVYGNAGIVPVITVDSKGRVTSATNVAIDGIASITYTTTTGNLAITSKDGTSRGVDIGVGTSDSPVFAGLSVSGNTTVNALTVNNTATIGSTLGVTGNINGSSATLSGSVVATGSGRFVGGLQATPIGNASASTGQFTTVSATGNITAAALTSNGSITAVTTLQAQGGIQNTPIGNATPSTGKFTTIETTGTATVNALTSNGAVSGTTAQFTTVNGSANATVNALTVNNSTTIGGTLGVTSNITGSGATLSGSIVTTGPAQHLGGIQATPIGNASASTGKFTTIESTSTATVNALTSNGAVSGTTAQFTTINGSANATINALTVNGSSVIGTTLQAAGGLQATPIGNTEASTGKFTTLETTSTATVNALTSNGAVSGTTAQFTTVNSSANATVNALTVNNSTTVGGTLGVTGNLTGSGATLSGSIVTTGPAQNLGGLQATPIGNVNPSTALFTTAGASGNVTASALTVNNSATVGSTLGVTGNLIAGNLSTGKISSSDLTNATGIGTGSFIVLGGGSVSKDFYVGGNLYTTNLIAVSSANIVVQDPLLYLAANTPYPYSYDIGFYSHFVGGTGNIYQHTGFVRDYTDSVWKLFSNAAEPTGTIIDFTNANVVYDSIKTGSHTILGALIANSTGSFGSNVTVNGLTVNTSAVINTTLQVAGGIQNTPIGNVTPSTALFTTAGASGNVTASALTVNNSATVGGTLGVTGNINATSATLSGSLVTTGPAQHLGGIQSTPIGNATASTGKFTTVETTGTATVNALTSNGAVSGTTAQFTTVNGSANATVNALTVNTSAVVGTTLQAAGGLQNTPIGNVTPSTAIFTTESVSGNSTVNALTVNNSATVGLSLGVGSNVNAAGMSLTNSATIVRTLQAAGGIQNTPIGNVTASSGQFTTVSATGNVTGAALTSNGSITAVTTLQAAGGLQATPIGNVTPSTAQFTTLNTSSNTTVLGLTVNNSATVGLSLGVGSNVNADGMSLTNSATIVRTLQAAGGIQNTPIGNVTPSTALFTTAGASGNVTANALTVNNSTTIGGTLGVTGNIAGSGATLSGSLVTTGPAQHLGGLQATPIGNATASTGKFTTIETTGTATVNALTSNGAVSGTTAQFTTVNGSANATVNALTINNSVTVGSTLGVTGSVTTSGNIYGTIGYNNPNFITPYNGDDAWAYGTFANVSDVWTQIKMWGGADTHHGFRIYDSFGSGNVYFAVDGTGITYLNIVNATGNITAPYFIGNVVGNISGNISAAGSDTQVLFNDTGLVAGDAGFTYNKTADSLTVLGNITAGGYTTNASGVFGTTLQAQGGLQNTPIGNATPSTGKFTTIEATGLATVNALTSNGAVSGTTAQFTTINGSANATVNALTVNGSATVGSTLGVTGNATIGNISSVGRIISTDTTQATGTGTGAFIVVGGGSVTKDFYVGGNLYTTNLIAVSSANIVVQDPLLYLTANTPYPYDYEIGFYSHFIGGTGNIYQHTGIVRDHSDGVWKLFSNAPEPSGTAINFSNPNVSYDPVKTGSHTVLGPLIANSTGSFGSNVTVNGLTVNTSAVINTTLQAAGGLQNTPIGNVTPSTALFTTIGSSGNATVLGLTVNNSATVGLSLGVGSNVNADGMSLTNSATIVRWLQAAGGIQNTPIGNITPSTALFTTIGSSGNTTVSALTVNANATIGTTLGVTGNVTAGNVTTAGLIKATATTVSTSNVTGAVQVSGGIGVAGNVYVGQRVGYVAANSVSAVYQIYNNSTNSLDTIFG